MIMGSDLLEHFDSWEGAEQIKQLCELVVFDRKRLLPGVQSSQIREAIKSNNFENLDRQVKDFIEKQGLY